MVDSKRCPVLAAPRAGLVLALGLATTGAWAAGADVVATLPRVISSGLGTLGFGQVLSWLLAIFGG